MNPKLKDAVEIFDKLGWQNVDNQNVLTLPLGTAEERKLALDGVKSGPWNGALQISETEWSWQSFVDGKEGNLALFAIRLGVNAKRAANIAHRSDKKALQVLLHDKGAKYATDTIVAICENPRNRFTEHSATYLAETAIRLVTDLDLEIPESIGYMKDWANLAASALDLPVKSNFWDSHVKKKDFFDKDLILNRFYDHAQKGISLGVPATGPFGVLVQAGVEMGIIQRGQAITWGIFSLNKSVRPGDRRAWLEVLEELDVTDEELCAHVPILTSALATGDNYLINQLGPRLIANVSTDELCEVIVSAFSTTTKKGKLLVLKAALKRDMPMNGEDLAPWLGIYILDKDGSISKAAQALMDKWQLSAEIDTFEETVDANVWQATPDVWELPKFIPEASNVENLTQLASKMVRRTRESHFYPDLETEKFLAMLVDLAYFDAELAKIAVQGLKSNWGDFLTLNAWTKGKLDVRDERHNAYDIHHIYSPIKARNSRLIFELEKIPCLLSTPSYMDLTITLEDLVSRLETYQKENVQPLEPDFLLALIRLDVTHIDVSVLTRLKKIKLDVFEKNYTKETGDIRESKIGDVSSIVFEYLKDPLIEPEVGVTSWNHWGLRPIKIPKSLAKFPNSRIQRYGRSYSVLEYPHFKEKGINFIRWNFGEVDRDKGIVMKQIAKLSTPLPPAALINFLGTLRTDTTDLCWEAVNEAWERGLLRPHVADVAFLDLICKNPTHLQTLATALDLVAAEGLLSVVWPILNDLIDVSLKAPKLITGTAELVDLVEKFLPAVKVAIENGYVDETALLLPAVRQLALKSGKSRGVMTAKQIVSSLPTVETKKVDDASEAFSTGPTFDEIWCVKEKRELIDDGVKVSVGGMVEGRGNNDMFIFNLSLPSQPDKMYQVVKGFIFDLETDAYAHAQEVLAGTVGYTAVDFKEEGELRWNQVSNALVFERDRKWRTDNEKVLSLSLLTVIIGISAQDGDAVYYGKRLVRKYIDSGFITDEVVARSMKVLLQYPIVSPGKLLRHLEKDVKLLSVMWPALTLSINEAGRVIGVGEKLPKWANRVLDVALMYGQYLVEAKNRGLIAEADFVWDGLVEIADMRGKSAAKEKALRLVEILGIQA